MNYFNYFTEIEETFIRRRGRHLFLSPLDWALMESWQEREIPIRIVLRGIENVFDAIDKNPNRVRTVKSLSYCKEEIEAQYAEWIGAQVGKTKEKEENLEDLNEQVKLESRSESTLFSDETIEVHLDSVSKSIELAKAKADVSLRRVLDSVAISLSGHRKTKTNAETLEKSLNKLESQIDKALLEANDGQRIETLKKEIEKELQQHKLTMDREVYKRTFDLMLIKNLREEAEIPPLSLFYL